MSYDGMYSDVSDELKNLPLASEKAASAML
jgi:hypothetical protein